MGLRASWETRSMGTTTFCTPTPAGWTGAPATVDVVAPVGCGAEPVGLVADVETTPLLVTTYAHRPSAEVATAKLPRAGVPVSPRGMSASAVRVSNSTGVTASVHTTYPTGPPGASDGSCTSAGRGLATTEQPDSTKRATASPAPVRP